MIVIRQKKKNNRFPASERILEQVLDFDSNQWFSLYIQWIH